MQCAQTAFAAFLFGHQASKAESKTEQRTKKEAAKLGAAAKQAMAVPSKAGRKTPSKSAEAVHSAVNFRTLALLGIAAVFGTVLTKPSAISSKTHDPVVQGAACSPQWLPMFLAQIPASPSPLPPNPPPPPTPPVLPPNEHQAFCGGCEKCPAAGAKSYTHAPSH